MKSVISKDKIFPKCPKCRGEILIQQSSPNDDTYWSDAGAICKHGGGLCWVGTVDDLVEYWSKYVYRFKPPKSIWDRKFRKKKK